MDTIWNGTLPGNVPVLGGAKDGIGTYQWQVPMDTIWNGTLPGNVPVLGGAKDCIGTHQ